MVDLRTAVIGVGHLGQHHARNYSALAGVELVAVSDTNEKHGSKIARKNRTAYVADYHELLDRVDCVSVATPTDMHHEVALDFLKQGVHVLVEKPMTTTVEQAEELIDAARKSGSILQVGHIERFNPAFRAVSPHLTEPRYITADRVSPFPFRSVDVSVVMDVMIHDLDLVLSLINSEIADVEAVGIPVISKTEDVANVRLRFENGAMAVITASRVSLKTERKLRIFQPDAYMTLDLKENKAKIFRKGERLKEGFDPALFDRRKISNLKAFLFGELIKIQRLRINEKEPLFSELHSFIEAAREGTSPECPGEAGIKAIRTAQRIHEAIRLNSKIVRFPTRV